MAGLVKKKKKNFLTKLIDYVKHEWYILFSS